MAPLLLSSRCKADLFQQSTPLRLVQQLRKQPTRAIVQPTNGPGGEFSGGSNALLCCGHLLLLLLKLSRVVLLSGLRVGAFEALLGDPC